MWIYKGAELDLEGIVGVPATDLTDEEFMVYSAKVDAQFRDQPGSLGRCGLWEHQSDPPPAPPAQEPSKKGQSNKEPSSDEPDKHEEEPPEGAD